VRSVTVGPRSAVWPPRRGTRRGPRGGALRGARGCGDAGFTVVELLGVLLVLGIVLAIAAPRIEPVKLTLRGAVHDVGTALLGAQRTALIRQHDVVVAFDLGAGRIRIHEDANNNGAVDPGERAVWRPLPQGIVFGRGGAPARALGAGPVSFAKRQDGFPALTFHRSGSVSEAGVLYLTSVRAEQGAPVAETWAVEIERATGRPSWYEYAPPGWRRSF
jgi:hypothetical protein